MKTLSQSHHYFHENIKKGESGKRFLLSSISVITLWPSPLDETSQLVMYSGSGHETAGWCLSLIKCCVPCDFYSTLNALHTAVASIKLCGIKLDLFKPLVFLREDPARIVFL